MNRIELFGRRIAVIGVVTLVIVAGKEMLVRLSDAVPLWHFLGVCMAIAALAAFVAWKIDQRDSRERAQKSRSRR